MIAWIMAKKKSGYKKGPKGAYGLILIAALVIMIILKEVM
jgi:hypothetical protein